MLYTSYVTPNRPVRPATTAGDTHLPRQVENITFLFETVTEPRMTEPRKTEPRKTERRKTEPRMTEPRKTEPRKGPNLE